MTEDIKQEVLHVAEASAGGFIVHYKRPPTEPKSLKIAINGVRSSAVFPSPSIPGYYLFMGEKFERNKVNKNPLVFLAEGEYHGYAELLEKFADDAIRLRCRMIYCQPEEGFLYELKKRIPTLYAPQHLPFGDDEKYGKILVHQWLKDESLDIPKDTVLTQHLTKSTEETLPPGFQALRQIVGGFLTDSTIGKHSGPRKIEVADHHWG